MNWEAEPINKSTIRAVKYPNEYTDTKILYLLPPPVPGEHNAEFLKSLGYDEKKLAGFRERSVA